LKEESRKKFQEVEKKKKVVACHEKKKDGGNNRIRLLWSLCVVGNMSCESIDWRNNRYSTIYIERERER